MEDETKSYRAEVLEEALIGLFGHAEQSERRDLAVDYEQTILEVMTLFTNPAISSKLPPYRQDRIGEQLDRLRVFFVMLQD